MSVSVVLVVQARGWRFVAAGACGDGLTILAEVVSEMAVRA